ncbi:MAG: hypothetical protein ABIT83_11555 [Massilia sp.]
MVNKVTQSLTTGQRPDAGEPAHSDAPAPRRRSLSRDPGMPGPRVRPGRALTAGQRAGSATATSRSPEAGESARSASAVPTSRAPRRRSLSHDSVQDGASAPPAEAAAPLSLSDHLRFAGNLALKSFVGALALSAGYRTLRNPGDLVSHPVSTLKGIVNFNARMHDGAPREAMQDVLQSHGQYIPADSPCYGVEPRIVFDRLNDDGSVGLLYRDPETNEPTDMALHAYGGILSGLHIAQHEYLHCFTHKGFVQALHNSPQKTEISEGITEFYADRFPGNPLSKRFLYDGLRLANGKMWTAAAAELEAAVGKDVLERAYFGGERDAIREVATAAVEIWPKAPVAKTWQTISSGPNQQRHALAECFVGVSLLYAKKQPDIAGLGFASECLPVKSFTDIKQNEAKKMIEQARAARERLGPVFDQAFCNFDGVARDEAMQQIRADIHQHWGQVLQHSAFARALKGSPQKPAIEKALSEYFSNPLRKSRAAAELEAAVGKEVLARAYFGGEPKAISEVGTAAVDILPKAPVGKAWQTIRFGPYEQRQALAECFVGVSLLYTKKLPDISGFGSSFEFLPVDDFTAIKPRDAAEMGKQAQAARQRLGPVFDQAFCNFDLQPQREAMDVIRADIHKHWKPLLSKS